jgi:hypothetical protein
VKTFTVLHRSGLGPVFECRAKRRGRGWSVLARNLDLDESWEYAEEMNGWESLASFINCGFDAPEHLTTPLNSPHGQQS